VYVAAAVDPELDGGSSSAETAAHRTQARSVVCREETRMGKGALG
jgi:hypothetical protein